MVVHVVQWLTEEWPELVMGFLMMQALPSTDSLIKATYLISMIKDTLH